MTDSVHHDAAVMVHRGLCANLHQKAQKCASMKMMCVREQSIGYTCVQKSLLSIQFADHPVLWKTFTKYT